MKRQLRIVLPDVHIPFQDDPLLMVWLNQVRELKPDGIDILGDLLDCYTLSIFDKNPARKGTLQDELDMVQEFLNLLCGRVGMNCDIRYSEGNHEERLRKVLWRKCPEFAGLRNFTIPELLGLKKLGIKWHSIQNPYCIGGLWFTHGDLLRAQAGASARAKADAIRGSVIVGHSHRTGWSPRTTWSGIEDAYDAGHLSDYTQLDYVRSVPNWQQGWAVVEYPPEGGHCVSFARIQNVGKKRIVVYRGEVIAKLGPAKQHTGG
ncbi:hypothetical protein LCGC14_2318150 [marine sediment metagenome]|uniref:Calcineurin-like phosphoesterase domain-containing protein n=1 Tax=marine sediment metagenome TaxID=412755 RepID=A0A0F9EW18_9ZZZZ